MSKNLKERNTNLDLLRIFSMFLIVFLHSIDHSGVLEQAETCGNVTYYYVRLTYGLCQVCVNIYVMLSGYFLVESKFRLHKLVTLWMQAAFYAFALKLIFMLSGLDDFSLISLAGCFFPILTGRYWFLTIYVGMYLVSPFLNILIRAMTRQQHGILNLCLFGLFSVWSSLHPAIAGMNSGGGWGLAWFVVLYLAAAWFRLYYEPGSRPVKWFAGYLLIPAVIAGLQLLNRQLGIGLISSILRNWFRYDSAPVYLMTVFLFVGFLNIRTTGKRASRLICTVAPLTLGVYLIHAHANVSPWLWDRLSLPEKMDGLVFPVIQMVSVLAIFAVCSFIDILRKHTIGRLEQCCWVRSICDRVTDGALKLMKGWH